MSILDKANCSMTDPKEQGRHPPRRQGGFGGMRAGRAGQSPRGYMFEVDLEYPSELWDSHNDYPLAPERLNVNGVEKLISHFKPRKKLHTPLSKLTTVFRDGVAGNSCS